ncbi:MAG TPA: hypothetical protein PLU87_06755 [Sedimentisphaerales bacterium]|nr:hypothetical protein [Sedimentisphaerales bacterium]HRS10551.1 hypothetical protein [Sedimentisphaerales bacterium]HRV47225.1 hypothetical protein [Sedimentisphaerales bacterium]
MNATWFLSTRWVLLAVVTALLTGSCEDDRPASPVVVGRAPRITPDYAGVVLPPNIAPLNFRIDEPGRRYAARIHSDVGEPVEILSRTGEILIPQQRWKALLNANVGKEITVDVYVKTEDGRWNQYQPIRNRIAPEPIDSHLVYRFMMPSSYFPKPMQICQRNLETFEETVLLDTRRFGNGCANCHSFVGNDPDRMLLGIRSTSFPSATVYAHDGRIEKIGAKFGYTAWHPSGRIVAYAINDVRQFFHTAQPEIHDVIDLDSIIVYYDIEKNQVRTAPALSDKARLETYPAWTPDGKYLYFCSAPLLWTDRQTVPPRRYAEVRYDLMRIHYDLATDAWGTLETVLSARDTGRSILLPRVSPDGRFLLFCMSRYGCFPVYQPTSDLYMMDLTTGAYREVAINSEHSESWHSWSSNSRWIVFSSKRQGGLYTRPYISYVDAEGRMHKPFVLPQRRPSFYESCYRLYSVPELVDGAVTANNASLIDAVVRPTQISVNSITGATPSSTEAYPKGRPSVQ